MLNSTFLFVLSGCVLGVMHVAVGIALGLWIRRGRGTGAGRGYQEMAQAERIAQRLQGLADDMSLCLGQHRSQLEKASRRLSAKKAGDERSLADLVAGVIGEVVHASGALQSKLEQAESRLQEQATEIEAHVCRAMTDALTGLPNRRALNDFLGTSLAAWSQHGEGFSLLMLDVDHFKGLNDQHGHVAGDRVLVAVGRALREALREQDVVARYGGEEFAVLLPATSLDEAAEVARKIHQAARQTTIVHASERLAVTVSGGLAMVEKGEDGASLIERADVALYAAKSAGRNCIYFHDGTDCWPLPELTVDNADRPAPREERTDESAQVAMLMSMVEALVQAGESLPAAWTGNPAHGGEPISVQLSEACDELRRYIARRAERGESTEAKVGSGQYPLPSGD